MSTQMNQKPSSGIRFVRRLGATLTIATLTCGMPLLSACGSDEPAKKEDPKPTVRAAPDEPWRKERPKAKDPAPIKLPTFQQKVLKNGLTVMVVEEHALPIVSVRLSVVGGSALDGVKNAGVAGLTYTMLAEGADGMSAAELAGAFDALGTRLSVGNDREAGVVGVSVLKRNLEPALTLVSRVVQKPSFDKTAFEAVKARALSGLVGKKGNPRVVAMESAAQVAFGAAHPYGYAASGTEATLKKIKASALKKFWSKVAGPKTSALIFAGDITLDEAEALATGAFGKWRGKAKRQKPPADPVAPTSKIHFLKAAAGSPQTVMLAGRALLAVGAETEIQTQVMNQILGGMFSSRLNMNLREDKAWSYGAFSFLDARMGKGPFFAGASVVAPHTADAVGELLKEFARLRTEPVTAEELKLAQDNIVKSLPGKFEDVGAMGRAATELFIYGRDLNYFNTTLETVRAVTVEDVKAAAELALAEDGLTVILVGDEAQAESVSKLEKFEVVVSEPGAELPR